MTTEKPKQLYQREKVQVDIEKFELAEIKQALHIDSGEQFGFNEDRIFPAASDCATKEQLVEEMEVFVASELRAARRAAVGTKFEYSSDETLLSVYARTHGKHAHYMYEAYKEKRIYHSIKHGSMIDEVDGYETCEYYVEFLRAFTRALFLDFCVANPKVIGKRCETCNAKVG